MMEEQNTVTTNQSKIRNNEAVHFTDHLYDGNIVLRSAKPFCDAGQWRYKIALPIVIIVLLMAWDSADMTGMIALVGLTGYFSWTIIRNRIAYKDVTRYNQKISFYLPYQMKIEELGEVVKKVLEPECKKIDVNSDCVDIQYKDLIITLFFDTQTSSGLKVRAGWEPISEEFSFFWARYWIFEKIIGGWRSKYAAQAVASISYIIYKTQQELFRTDEGSRQYYTGNPGIYQKVKHSICHILFNIIVGIALLCTILSGDE